MKQVGFIGVGIMGSSMVRNLMKDGYEVHIYARNKEKVEQVIADGAVFHDTIAECVKGRDAVITIVGYPQDVEDVYLGEDKILESADPGTYLIDMTTTSPSLDAQLAKEAAEKGLKMLDAPVTGGDYGARSGTLSILVGGAKEDYEACLDLFSAMGKNITWYGPSGCGQHAKLANQIMQAGIMSGVCEALSYVKEKGLDPEVFMEGAAAGAGQNALLQAYGPRIVKGDQDPGFFIDFFIKDLKLAYDSAAESGLVLDSLANTVSHYEKLSKEGFGRLGMQALMKYYEK